MKALAFLLMVPLVVVSLAAVVQPAGAIVPQNQYPYAVVCLKNFTNVPIYYSFRWGNSGVWESREIDPGGSHWHSWKYDLGSRISPDLYVKFDASLASGDVKEYVLERYAVRAKVCALGKGYDFIRDGNIVDLQQEK